MLDSFVEIFSVSLHGFLYDALDHIDHCSRKIEFLVYSNGPKYVFRPYDPYFIEL